MRSCALALAVVGLAFGVSGCTNKVSVEFPIGTAQMPILVSVSADNLGLPPSLENMSNGTVASISCAAAPCPQLSGVTLACDSNQECDPAPVTISIAVQLPADVALTGQPDVFDLDAVKSQWAFGTIDSFTIQSVDANVTLNTLTVDVPQLQLYWSSAGSAQPETLLGTVAPISAGYQGTAPVTMDQAGVSSLSDYLLNTEPRAKFWVQAQLDLNPGDPWPAGSITVAAIVHVQVTGSLL